MPKTLQERVDRVMKARTDRDMTASTSGAVVAGVVIPMAGARGLIPTVSTLAGTYGLGSWMVHLSSMELGKSLREKHGAHANMIAREGANIVYVNDNRDLAATDHVPVIGGYSRIVIDPKKLTAEQRKRLERRMSLPNA